MTRLAIAVPVGDRWQSLVPAVDIASCGATADEALSAVLEAVQEAEEVVIEQDMVKGAPTSVADLTEFLLDATAPAMVVRIET